MEITIKTKGKQQEKYLLAILNSSGIAYTENKKNVVTKQTSTKINEVTNFINKWGGSLNGVEKIKDEKVQRIIRKNQ